MKRNIPMFAKDMWLLTVLRARTVRRQERILSLLRKIATKAR